MVRLPGLNHSGGSEFTSKIFNEPQPENSFPFASISALPSQTGTQPRARTKAAECEHGRIICPLNNQRQKCQPLETVSHVGIRKGYISCLRRSGESMCEARKVLKEPDHYTKQQGVTVVVVAHLSRPPILEAHGLHATTSSLTNFCMSNVKPSRGRVLSLIRTFRGLQPVTRHVNTTHVNMSIFFASLLPGKHTMCTSGINSLTVQE